MSAPASPAVLSAPPRGRVLVFAPHPDDETIGCGGALALHSDQGDETTVVFVSDGAAGDPEGRYPREGYLTLRKAEAGAAARILRITRLQFWDLPDGALSHVSDLVGKVATTLNAERPDVVYYPSAAELHPDHHAVAVAVRDACTRRPRTFALLSFEIWAPVRPTHILDITSVWERKRAAIEQYRSQLAYNDYLHKISGLNAYRSLYLPRARYVEAFGAPGHT